MTDTTDALPPRLAQIVEDFSWVEGRDKLELLLEYSEKMPPLPDWLNRETNMEQIHECMTPVFVHAELEDGGMHYYFDIPPESPTVRGYAAILGEGLQGVAPEDVLKVPGNFYIEMGLHKVLTTQRLNGIGAILAHIKRLATQALTQ
ncbi:MAG TPA: SufE family protein [Anaerolineae bacterium]|nr:SufE family protein [Anaerolineae bacterium]MCB0178308.1 SufE family protein [Anaerolineae bacterium]MCB9107577.1 SufE family protein [Anaerolineales bacterium]HRV95488.1 SufE family protein [Anaerolineae bacterium]